MDNNQITGEAAQELIKALKENSTLQVLRLPKYPENITKVITELQEVINVNRKEHGCDYKLEIKFSNLKLLKLYV